MLLTRMSPSTTPTVLKRFAILLLGVSVAIAAGQTQKIGLDDLETSPRDTTILISPDLDKRSFLREGSVGDIRNQADVFSSATPVDVDPEGLLLVDTASCYSHTACSDCVEASSTCHWCENDGHCHVIGSWDGCIVGTDCDATKSPTKSPIIVPDNSCASHDSCTECALSSLDCHWCEFDDRCHAIGSPYGCFSGVDCYSNSRCMRTEPERKVSYVTASLGIFLTLAAFSCVAICCLSAGYLAAGAAKGAYDDLATIVASGSASPAMEGDEPLLQNDGERTKKATEGATFPPPPHSDNAQCLFSGCRLCYLLTVFTILSSLGLSAFYFPAVPAYSMCSDSMDWKSIMDGMTSLKMEASFELLLSAYNPNRFDLSLTMGSGTFSHDGVYVGKFEIPSTRIKKQSITDILFTATFTPDKWTSLELASEYYKGTLTLLVNAKVAAEIPYTNGYIYEADISNYFVHLSDAQDRALCACPLWSDVKEE